MPEMQGDRRHLIGDVMLSVPRGWTSPEFVEGGGAFRLHDPTGRITLLVRTARLRTGHPGADAARGVLQQIADLNADLLTRALGIEVVERGESIPVTANAAIGRAEVDGHRTGPAVSGTGGQGLVSITRQEGRGRRIGDEPAETAFCALHCLYPGGEILTLHVMGPDDVPRETLLELARELYGRVVGFKPDPRKEAAEAIPRAMKDGPPFEPGEFWKRPHSIALVLFGAACSGRVQRSMAEDLDFHVRGRVEWQGSPMAFLEERYPLPSRLDPETCFKFLFETAGTTVLVEPDPQVGLEEDWLIEISLRTGASVEMAWWERVSQEVVRFGRWDGRWQGRSLTQEQRARGTECGFEVLGEALREIGLPEDLPDRTFTGVVLEMSVPARHRPAGG